MSIPEDIISHILEFLDLKCRVCKKKFNTSFIMKENKNLYCSDECYNFI